MIVRNERPEDHRTVEELIRKAFWNVYSPGCDEHYLAHILRGHEDFLPELDLVLEEDGKIIGSVMYVKARLYGENGAEKEILSFGPLAVLPEYQRCGYGKKLLEDSFERAVKLGYDTVVIFGNPENYIARGFKSCKRYQITTAEGVYPVPLLVKELKEGALEGKKWIYRESPAYRFDEKDAEKFDLLFEPMTKGYQPSQELFYIYSHSRIN